MVARHGDTEQAVLKMLQRHRVIMMDEVMTKGQPDFTWSEIFLAIDRLSRKQLTGSHSDEKLFDALTRKAGSLRNMASALREPASSSVAAFSYSPDNV